MEKLKRYHGLVFLLVWKMLAADRPPKILTQSSDRTVYFTNGQQLEIPCVAYGTPLPRYQWTINGVLFDPLGNDDRVKMKTGVGTLIFQRVIEKDEGLYQCYANNGIGTAVSDIVDLRKAYINDFIQTPVEVHQVYLDFPLTLKCPIPSSQPPATVHWETKSADGTSQPLTLSNRVSTSLEGSLYFSDVIASDNKNDSVYYCVSTNHFLGKVVKGPGHTIIIHGTTKHMFPVSLSWSSPSNMLVLEGGNATLKCIFSGNPTPDVYWSRGNFSTLSPKMIQNSWGQQLLIPNVNKSDEGIYECLGINTETATPVIHQVNIIVESRPVWARKPRDVETRLSETVTINCTAYGVPAPHYRWFINGVDVSVLKVGTIINNIQQVSSEPSILTIHNATLVDQMNIQCNATNIHGYIFTDIALNVRGTATFPRGNKTAMPSLCMDALGMVCAKIKSGGHCNDATIASYCRHTCNICTAPNIIG